MTMQNCTILIVDSAAENLGMLFDFLTKNNFEVLIENSGEGALQRVDLAGPRPDLIVLEVTILGINGFETCKRLKANPKTQDIPVIFMTNVSDTSDKLKGFELGAVDYVTKPCQQNELLARIETHLTICKLKQQIMLKKTELEAQYNLTLQLNAQLQQQKKKLEREHRLTLQLNTQLQQEIFQRQRIEIELQKTYQELHLLGNFSTIGQKKFRKPAFGSE